LTSAPVLKSYPAREAALRGGLVVRRALPRAGRRLVGPWCFLDHYGPLAFGAHPHIGLQTVAWLIHGEALMGELNGVRSPAKAHSRMVGADIVAGADGVADVPLDPSFEHAVVLIDGEGALENLALEPSTLY